MRTSSRTPLRAGVTAALLPLCLAVPALSAPASANTPDRVGIVGPTTTVNPSMQAVRVSVHDNGAPVAGATVQLQRETRGGWAPAGTITTDGQGEHASRPGAGLLERAEAALGGQQHAAARHRGALRAAPGSVQAIGPGVLGAVDAGALGVPGGGGRHVQDARRGRRQRGSPASSCGRAVCGCAHPYGAHERTSLREVVIRPL